MQRHDARLRVIEAHVHVFSQQLFQWYVQEKGRRVLLEEGAGQCREHINQGRWEGATCSSWW